MRRVIAVAIAHLACVFILVAIGVTQEVNTVTAHLSLAGGKGVYRMGDSIPLEVTFTTTSGNFSVDSITGQPGDRTDTFLITPAEGTYPINADMQRGQRYARDYLSAAPLTPEKPVILRLELTSAYRFDRPGHYSLKLVTPRVMSAAVGFGGRQTLTTNEVEFDIQAFPEADEAAEAERLENLIRESASLREAQSYASKLEILTGVPSTRVKLDLYLHPKEFYPFAVDMQRALWMARDRAFVVTELEKALVDPSLPVDSMFRLAASLKGRLLVPYDFASPDKSAPQDSIEDDYARRVVTTLPQRTGQNLTTTAITLLVSMASRKQTQSPEFNAVRESLITHFADVNEYKIDWVLNSYGQYLEDARLAVPLEERLRSLSLRFSSSRAAIWKQLQRINAVNRELLVTEICRSQIPPDVDVLSKAPFDSLPETDACLRDSIRSLARANNVRLNLELQQKATLAARFATASIAADLYEVYTTMPVTDGGVRGALLAYLARRDADRARPLLEAALPASAESWDGNVTYGLSRSYFSPALEEFLRARLSDATDRPAATAAYLLSSYGTLDHTPLILKRLARWRSQWRGKDIPREQMMVEVELAGALVSPRSKLSEDEADKVREGCLTDECHTRVRKPSSAHRDGTTTRD